MEAFIWELIFGESSTMELAFNSLFLHLRERPGEKVFLPVEMIRINFTEKIMTQELCFKKKKKKETCSVMVK